MNPENCGRISGISQKFMADPLFRRIEAESVLNERVKK